MRPLLLLGAAGLAFALAIGPADGSDPAGESGPVVEPVAREVTTTAAVSAAAISPSRTKRVAPDDMTDLFTGRTWLPPPPPAPPPAPVVPAAPAVPPAPYAYLGRLEAPEAQPLVYLSRGERLVEVRVGELVDPEWKLESFTEEEIVLLYVPLGRPQVLRIGSTR